MAERFHDWSMKIDRVRGFGIEERGQPGETYLQGEVITPQGIVTVYSQGGPRWFTASSYRIVVNGRLHTRGEKRRRTKRGLAIMAGRFAREIAG